MLSRLTWLTCMIACAATVAWLQYAQPQRPAVEGVTFGFNEGKPVVSPELARLATFGYDRALTALLWVRFLQNTPPEKAPPGTLSWIYYDLNAISQLDPDFLPVYHDGALFLSVINEDHAGAERILKRGVELHPDHHSILGALAYHYQFELHEPAKAGPLYVAAAKLPNAPYIYAVQAASYLQKNSSSAAGITLLKGMLERTQDQSLRSRIIEKIKHLEQGS